MPAVFAYRVTATWRAIAGAMAIQDSTNRGRDAQRYKKSCRVHKYGDQQYELPVEYTFVALIDLIEGSVRMINGRLMTQTALDAEMDCHWFAARKAPLSETPLA